MPTYDIQGNSTFSDDDEFNDNARAQVASIHIQLCYQIPYKIKLNIVRGKCVDSL